MRFIIFTAWAFGLLISCQFEEKNIHLFFDKYPSGWYVIIYNVDSGLTVDREESNFFYKFGDSRILKLSGERLPGAGRMVIKSSAGKVPNEHRQVWRYRDVALVGGGRVQFTEFYFGNELPEKGDETVTRLLAESGFKIEKSFVSE
jgi:hypothetical protein